MKTETGCAYLLELSVAPGGARRSDNCRHWKFGGGNRSAPFLICTDGQEMVLTAIDRGKVGTSR